MKGRTLLFVALGIGIVTALGGVAAVSATDGGTAEDVAVELYVTDDDGDPIGNVDAVLEWEDGSVETTTRSNGRVFEDVPADADLEITLTHDEYVQNVPATVSDVDANQEVALTMYDPATATVDVTNTEGEPVEDATVRLDKVGQSEVADEGETDGDGTFESAEVEEGSYTLEVRKEGYYDHDRDVELSGDVSESVEIEAGTVTVDLLVQDPTSDDPEALSADVDVEHDGQRIVSATTNDEGQRSVTLDVNTQYDVTTTREDYKTKHSTLRTGESDRDYVINVTRTETISIEGGSSQVVVGEQLRVEVTDEYDRPVEGATVAVGGDEEASTDAEATTDADGVAHVEIPESGEVEVTATYENRDPASLTVTGVGGDDATEEEDGGDDGDDGSPGFGVVAALIGVLVAAAVVARRR